MVKQILLLMATAFFSCVTMAGKIIMVGDVPVEVTDVGVNGSGCPTGSIDVTATEDNTQVVILFSEYRAITDSVNTLAVADCNISLGLAVPAGFSVGIVDIDWRGTVVAGAGSFINFHREFFFSGDRGESVDEFWSVPGFENFFLEDDPAFITYSSCSGNPLIARADTSATVIGANSLFTLRSADFQSKLLFTLSVQKC